MQYYHTRKVQLSFERAIEQVKEALGKVGFSVITEIDLSAKFQEKLGLDFRKYTILGACNPRLAYEAIQKEEKVGLLLPCNMLVQQHATGEVEISVIDPVASVGTINNPSLQSFAREVSEQLQRVLSNL